MIGIRRSDEPTLAAAAAAMRGDRNAVRAAITRSEKIAAQSDMRSIAQLVQQICHYFQLRIAK
jgi:hypothetical protein